METSELIVAPQAAALASCLGPAGMAANGNMGAAAKGDNNKCLTEQKADTHAANRALDSRTTVPICETKNVISTSDNSKIAKFVPQKNQSPIAQDNNKKAQEVAELQVEHHQSTTTNNNNNIITLNQHQQTNNNNNLCQNVSSASLLLNCISSNSRDESDADCQINARDFTLLSKETQELKTKTRKLQLEIDEKNEIINILKDELETTKEQSDKFQRDNLQLLKDSKRVKFLQDENDFLQDKMGNVDKLELEIKRLKEKLAETEFLKLRIGELEEDKDRAQEESSQFEEKWQKAEQKLTRVIELETELNKWKSFSHDLELERNSIQSRLLESIEQEAKLNSTKKQVEDEVKRLRSLIKHYEEQRDEEQASNSLIMSVADLKQLDQQQQDHGDILETTIADTSIKFEIDQQLEKELNEENRNLKQKLNDQEFELKRLLETNQEIRNELENNKNLISDLRQDLACEKSLASKLAKQLTTFSKQIKNLDKQYFPIHDPSSTQQSTPISLSPLTTTETNQTKPPSSSITHEETDNRKSHETSSNTINNENECKHEENESSPSKYVSSLEYQRQQKSENTLCESDKKKSNPLQGNNCDNSSSSHNETRQQLGSRKSGSKLSAHCEDLDKNYTQPDNGIKSDKQSISNATQNASIEGVGDLLSSSNQEVRLSSAQTSAALNKSTATENFTKVDDKSCAKGLLSTADRRKLDSPSLRTNDRSEPATRNLSPTSLIDRQDEQEASTRYAHGSSNIIINNNNCNNFSNGSNVGLASVSPSSSARSQSSSPSATITIGHDSGFQSINHDFNRISSPNADVRKVFSTRLATIDSSTLETSQSRSAHNATTSKKQVASSQGDRSLPFATQDATKLNLESPSAAAGPNIVDPAADRRLSEPPTKIGIKVPLAADIANVAEKDSARSQSSGYGKQDGSQQRQDASHSGTTTKPPPSSSLSSSKLLHASISAARQDADSIRRSDKESDADSKQDADDAVDNHVESLKSDTPRSTKSRKFVRNSLPSRSVNFGHSKSSAYLDRIRASVTATTTTTNTTSSFNGQTRNIVLSTQPDREQPSVGNNQVGSNNRQHNHRQHHVLNCMLDHQHGERCFVNNPSQTLAASQQPVSVDGHRNVLDRPVLQSSRQLNALIDPVSNEELMMSLLHQSHGLAAIHQRLHPHVVHQSRVGPYAPLDIGDLTEQQIARLTSLHHQHYYHHLQHMHQLHQLHHQHHMHVRHHGTHNRYQQQQPQHNEQQAASGSQPVAGAVGPQQESSACVNQAQRRLCEQQQIYSGGSQFYAPSAQFDQIYSSMTANNNNNNHNVNHVNEYHRTRLVTNGNNSSNCSSSGKSPESASLHSSPNNGRQGSRIGGPHKTQQQQQSAASHYATLPQIDEVNGLPVVDSVAVTHQRGSPVRQHRNAQVVMTSEAIAKQKQQQQLQQQQHNSSTNGSPSSSSSSPTSSTSSIMSPSSASSSSSLNSLSTSSVPLNRSALRHTTTELNRRQFSIERELNNALPMTATLSRVGSCRVNRSAGCGIAAQSVCNQRSVMVNGSSRSNTTTNNTNDNIINHQVKDASQMQIPVKTQQPSMRTSKILNISQQSGLQSPPSQQQQQQQQQLYQQLSNQLGNRRASLAQSDVSTVGVDNLASNLANIRLIDNLAFTSLRAPKSSSSCAGGSLSRSLLTNNGSSKAPKPAIKTKAQSIAPSSSEKHKLADKQPLASDSSSGAKGGKSSVWFEYGCV